MDNIYKNIKGYNQDKKRKILIFFYYMIAHMLINKKLNPEVTELFVRGRKLKISLAFITDYSFSVLKEIKINCTHYFIMKIPNK